MIQRGADKRLAVPGSVFSLSPCVPKRLTFHTLAEAPIALILDLVEWVDKRPRPYEEVIDAWRTSCPRLPVWEDAIDDGYLARTHDASGEPMICVTTAGRRLLLEHRRRHEPEATR